MSIPPENKARYPKDWPHISKRIRFERAGNRCECGGECGDDHGGRCSAINYEAHPITGSKVILTVAHLDHVPEHCEDENLKAMCQRCHNRYDNPKRRAGIRERAFAGQGSLFPASPEKEG